MDKEPIDLKDVEKDNSTDLDWKRYHIFKDLLQYDNPTTPVEAARQIDELISTKKGVEGESEIDFVEGYLWYLWGLLIDIVKLVPYNHAGQGKLLSTLEALSQLPPTTMKIWGIETRVWTDLPLLGPCMREGWDRVYPMHDDEPPNENSAQHWINFNAFTARLLDAGLAKWTNFAVWALRDALEEPTLAKPIMNCRVAVAAEWVLQSGEAFFRCISEEVDKDEARSTKPGALYLGKEGLCNERWGFWKKRLLEVSKQVDTNIEERAIRAVEKMEKIEQSNI